MTRPMTIALALILSFTACNRGAPTPDPATPAPTEGLAPPSSTIPATALASPTTTAAESPTPAATTESAATPGVSDTPAGDLVDRAEYVADVTVPDGEDHGPGSSFTKTWRIKNVGSTTWTTQYVLEFVSGASMAASNVNFPGEVAPGSTVDLSVNMTAPAAAGRYTGLWQFRNPSGVKFGVGPNFNEVIYVQIDVVAGLPAGGSAAATRVPTPAGPLNPAKVTKVTISADNANVQNDCPHTFVFTAIMNVEGGGVVKYQLEASSTTEGFVFNLPAPLESTFTTNGPHTFGVAYTLEIRNAVNGQVWLHVTSPNDISSDKLAFSLTCPPTPTFVPLPTFTPAASATAAP